VPAGPSCTSLESVVDRGRGYEERHADSDLKEGRVRKNQTHTKDSCRL